MSGSKSSSSSSQKTYQTDNRAVAESGGVSATGESLVLQEFINVEEFDNEAFAEVADIIKTTNSDALDFAATVTDANEAVTQTGLEITENFIEGSTEQNRNILSFAGDVITGIADFAKSAQEAGNQLSSGAVSALQETRARENQTLQNTITDMIPYLLIGAFGLMFFNTRGRK
jgi:hypothetical protein